MKNDNQGFHAQICENQYKPIYDFSEFDKWLEMWSGEYTEAKLSESIVESYENFAFVCVIDVMKEYRYHDHEWKKREFKMKAYFETDTWLIKETKIGCDHF
uniref:FBA_2 domain-containing protein n=1 Tax=Caenorhabditis tropicalis TaxID=1561998 RepID=A0A1I7ULF6_9PELO